MADEPIASFFCQGAGQTAKVDRFGYAYCPVCGWADPNPADVVQHVRGVAFGTIRSHDGATPSTTDPGRNAIPSRGLPPRWGLAARVTMNPEESPCMEKLLTRSRRRRSSPSS